MPYANIVFAKLEKRILNDPRWFMLSESAQLNYIRLILAACETYNRIPKNPTALKKMFRTELSEEQIVSDLLDITKSFPKLKENGEFYFFEDFHEKTNYIPKEIQRKSKGTPKDGTEEEEEEEKKKNNNKKNGFDFNSLWDKYPRRDGRKAAEQHFQTQVKTEQDWRDINTALDNYLQSDVVQKGDTKYIKNGSTWFNNWRDWIVPPLGSMATNSRGPGLTCEEAKGLN